jgi:carbon-monoxide dehydrogenase small subunit
MMIALTINGEPVKAEVAPRTHLADFLREQLLLTGTHIGCEHGICGACTVEIDGEIARSCITYAVVCDGARVRTIEGFDDDALMGQLRQAFTEAHALQCGYCTPGMLIAARDLIRRKRRLTRAEIRTAMSGNLCRCTGYMGIVDAIERVMATAHAARASSAPREGRQPTASSPEPNPPTTQEPDEGTGAQRGATALAHSLAGSVAGSWLGPAPGPGASPVPTPHSEVASGPPAEAAARPPGAASAKRPRAAISVMVGALEEAGGETRIRQSFVLQHPRAAVWRLMSDVAAAARCMPGLTLDGPPVADKVSGRLAASIGPIRADFSGAATLRRFPDEFRQILQGSGGDRRSGSRASGSVDYRLTPLADAAGREATRVDIILGYALTGPLAQIGRVGLVADLVRRIGEAFAQNLDLQLRHPEAAMPQARLDGLALLLKVLAARVRAALGRLSGRGP